MRSPTDLLTTEEAARYLTLSPRTLERYRVTGEGPRFLKIGRRVVYRRCDLDAWLKNKIRRSTSDPGPDADSHSDSGSGSDSGSESGSNSDVECQSARSWPRSPPTHHCCSAPVVLSWQSAGQSSRGAYVHRPPRRTSVLRFRSHGLASHRRMRGHRPR